MTVVPPPTVPSRPMERWSAALDLRDLARRFGTPLYLHHPGTLRRAIDAYAALVGAAGIRYPVKANPSPLVLEALAAAGAGADCASRVEVQAALAAGIPLSRISFTTPAPDLDDALWLLRQGATVVADGLDLLRALDTRLRPGDLAGALFVRVNPGALPAYAAAGAHQRYTAHGDARSQFGVPAEDLPAALAQIRLPVTGLHVHVGSMMDNLAAFPAAVAALHALRDAIAAYTPHAPHTLNLGGGLGLPHTRDEHHPPIDALAATLRGVLRPDLRYLVEPGNSLVGDSFGLLASLVAVKTTRGRTWGIADVGTDQLIKHTVAGWRHEIVDADHRPLPTHGPDALAGPLCFAGDVLLAETDLAGARPGDPLLIRHTGAYCAALASRFNGRRGPPTVVVGPDGAASLVAEAEDPFYAGDGTRRRPVGPGEPAHAVPIPAARVAALQSATLHTHAREDAYDFGPVHQTGPHTYHFEVTTDAHSGAVTMPLALRIAGDAAIIAVGLALGWDAKRGPVLASRLTLSVDTLLPGRGTHPCRVALSALAPSGRDGDAREATVRFELGEGPAIHGTARVTAPHAHQSTPRPLI